MTAPPPAQPVPAARGRWRLAALLLVMSGAGAAAAWWYLRSGAAPPEPPVVDLSRAEPEVAGAITAARDAVRARPREAATWGKFGMLLRAHDFDTDSLAAFRTAAELDPADYRWPYLEGLTRVLYEPGPGLERLRKAAELAPVDRPQPRLRLAELLLESGDLDGAASAAAEAQKGQPMNPRAELVLARVAAARGAWQTVLDRATACAADPGAARAAVLLRAQAYAARDERDRAEVEMRRLDALPEGGGWPDPVVTEVENMRVGTAARLARAHARLAEERPDEAVALLNDELRRTPDHPRATLMLGQALIKAGDASTARRVLEEHTGRSPNSVEAWFHLGVARFFGDDFAGARDAFRRAVALKPDHALAHFNLGHSHRKLGDKAAARAAFEAALRCRPDHQPARQALADLDAGK